MKFLELLPTAFAQRPPSNIIPIINPLCDAASADCTIVGILERIAGYLIFLGAPILALLIIYGGFKIMSAGGDPGKIKSGRDTILWAVVGYGIIFISWGVISLVKQLLTGNATP
jgi:hypothetical protein